MADQGSRPCSKWRKGAISAQVFNMRVSTLATGYFCDSEEQGSGFWHDI